MTGLMKLVIIVSTYLKKSLHTNVNILSIFFVLVVSREGLRTLVVSKKPMSESEYEEFEKRYNTAKSSKVDRANLVYQTMCEIENEMQLLCVTGVEDKLQKDVKITLEMLRNAGIKIWMLTGDKLETAICIAKSSKLVSPQQQIYVFREIIDRTQVCVYEYFKLL